MLRHRGDNWSSQPPKTKHFGDTWFPLDKGETHDKYDDVTQVGRTPVYL